MNGLYLLKPLDTHKIQKSEPWNIRLGNSLITTVPFFSHLQVNIYLEMMKVAEDKRKRFQSVKSWVKNILDYEAKLEVMMDTFEEEYIQAYQDEHNKIQQIDPDAPPVNILLLDGGGMRGYAIIAIMECIKDHFQKEGQDITSQFDLIAGSSVGGIMGYYISHHKSKGASMDDMIRDGRTEIDEYRENSFGNIDFANLCCCGTRSLIPYSKQMVKYMKKNYGDIPLRQKHAIPAMACISVVKQNPTLSAEEERIADISKREVVPLIARTYDYPNENDRYMKDDNYIQNSSGMKLYEAMAGTGSPPVLTDRVRAKVDGVTRIMADGGMVFGNCPITMALDEARRLYPNRRIGTILNIGYTIEDEARINRVLETVRLVHRDLHFQRLAPYHIMDDVSPMEADLKRIAEMEAKVKDWFLNTKRVRNATEVTLKELFSTPPRDFGRAESYKDSDRNSSLRESLKSKIRDKIRERMTLRYSKQVSKPMDIFSEDSIGKSQTEVIDLGGHEKFESHRSSQSSYSKRNSYDSNISEGSSSLSQDLFLDDDIIDLGASLGTRPSPANSQQIKSSIRSKNDDSVTSLKRVSFQDNPQLINESTSDSHTNQLKNQDYIKYSEEFEA